MRPSFLYYYATVLLFTGGAAFAQDNRLEEALQRLAEQREEIASEKIPMARELNTLEAEVLELRQETQRQQRMADSADLEMAALQTDRGARQEELDYISGLVTEFLSGMETRADPSELPVYRESIDRALLAVDHAELPLAEQMDRQLTGVGTGLERLSRILGGITLEGEAISPKGDLLTGRFFLFGPASFFRADNGEAGIAVRGDTDLPVLVASGHEAEIAATVENGSGRLPLDPTLGKALAIRSTEEGLIAHITKGGIWIYPILFAAALSLAIACFKFLEIGGIRKVANKNIRTIAGQVRAGQKKEALEAARSLPQPGAGLVETGIRNAGEPKDLLEEILLERIVELQPKIERLLPVIAVTAATAPLLGLLGTVTGMINTFKLITLFGTGDARSLSSGISEALITTEFGLIVAIPSLILHAVLHRKAKAILASLEANAMSFINHISVQQRKAS